MLELKEIVKDYPAGDGEVHALRGITLSFRRSEFVSILGQSGCGKTTMLNIIGGLDKYTSGDLIINGRSTKDFRGRDWDAYRNHSVGFVFQSYNLISHQSVLANVELALSLSGVGKSERRQRAVKALEKVGLGDQLRKKPAEMSGGQMQRVAIARAIVNDPDIILADEPTGALDSETSVQVMELLKEISRDRLVIMVTHNPELAEKYSTRIVRMLDGQVISDSAPLSEKELDEGRRESKGVSENLGKPSLSLGTSFGLSLKNLFTKKGRTILTSFAGSIGIIGIALIMAVSQGTTNYIDAVQEDTLSSYPLTLESNHVDLGSLMQTFINSAKSDTDHPLDAVYQKPALYETVNAMASIDARKNDLAAFKTFLENELDDPESELSSALSGVRYSYKLEPQIYTKSVDGQIIRSDMQELMSRMMIKHLGSQMSGFAASGSNMSSMSSMLGMGYSGTWQEMLSGLDGEVVNPILEKQYDVVYGRFPEKYNEVVLVLDKNNEIDDMTLYALGLKSEEEIDKIAEAAVSHEKITYAEEKWSYEDICGSEFRVILDADCYSKDESTGLYTDLRETSAGLKYLYDNALSLKVVGIIRPNEDAVSSMLTGSVGYTSLLTEYVIERAKDSDAIKAQLSDKTVDILSGLEFRTADSNSEADLAEAFREKVGAMSDAEKAEVFKKIIAIPSDEVLSAQVEAVVGPMTRADMENAILSSMSGETGMDPATLSAYISAMSDEDLRSAFSESVAESVKRQYASSALSSIASMNDAQLSAMFDEQLNSMRDADCAKYYKEVLDFSDSTLEENLEKLGMIDLDDPASINLYASGFEDKDKIEAAIEKYNDTVDEIEKITYTDYVGIMMSSVTTIINAITYVLIAFVAVSLIVSSIMIGVITLISVQERTKEIGILRAIGASKRNVAGMFNAETTIIGFTAGALGVLITYLLCVPINLILHNLTGINNLSASLPIPAAVILVAISVLLTLIAGIIPSRSAARKDPVVALRTE